jgi:CheY-like chemotaxis protein/two-component sensor histidine kinase
LEDERDNPYLNEISEIIKTTEKAASLTAQLLAFSKRQVLQPKLLNLNSIIKQMYSMLRRTFPSYITLHFDLSTQDLPVIIDKVQFEQVILNLAFNAKEAILPKGKGNIRISSKLVKSQEIDDKIKFYAQVSIEDDGIGMNETTKNSAFEPFFTTKLKGTGLGLSTVYGIVSQSDGYIEIDSEIGKGTCFKAHFPIKFEKVQTSILQANELSSLSGQETILLIEDDKDVRKILSLLLRKSGYMVIEARNGIDGLEQYSLKRESIDLVISDLVMPEMGGLEVIQKIRAKNPLIKSMFISGYTGDQQGILGKDETIITKPIDRVKLLETIKSILCCIPEREANA